MHGIIFLYWLINKLPGYNAIIKQEVTALILRYDIFYDNLYHDLIEFFVFILYLHDIL